jgi:hypothetical protein
LEFRLASFCAALGQNFQLFFESDQLQPFDSTEDFNRSTEAVFYLIRGVCLQLAALENTSRQM